MATIETGTRSDVLDRETALMRLRGNEQLLFEVMQLFREQCPILVEDLRRAAMSIDVVAVERIAHTIRGSAGVLAAHAVVQLAQDIETLARAGDLSDVDIVITQLESAVEDVIAATLHILRVTESATVAPIRST